MASLRGWAHALKDGKSEEPASCDTVQIFSVCVNSFIILSITKFCQQHDNIQLCLFSISVEKILVFFFQPTSVHNFPIALLCHMH